MTEPTPWETPALGTEERSLRRRRLLAAVVTVAAFVAVAGGSALGAVAGAHDDRADTGPQVAVIGR